MSSGLLPPRGKVRQGAAAAAAAAAAAVHASAVAACMLGCLMLACCAGVEWHVCQDGGRVRRRGVVGA